MLDVIAPGISYIRSMDTIREYIAWIKEHGYLSSKDFVRYVHCAGGGEAEGGGGGERGGRRGDCKE